MKTASPLLSQEFKYRTRKYLAGASFAAAGADIILASPYVVSALFTAAALASYGTTAYWAIFRKPKPPTGVYIRDSEAEEIASRLSAKAGIKVPDVYCVPRIPGAAADLEGNLLIDDHSFIRKDIKSSVVAHELTHIRNGDVYGLLTMVLGFASITLAHAGWALGQPSNLAKSAVVLPALFASYSLFMKSVEHLADIGSLKLTGSADPLIEMLEKHSETKKEAAHRQKKSREKIYKEFPFHRKLYHQLFDKIDDYDYHPSPGKRVAVLKDAERELHSKLPRNPAPLAA